MSTTTTVTLSAPPASLAASIRALTAVPGSVARDRISPISASETWPCNPSEESISLSPTVTSTSKESGSMSGSLPSARVITERFGWKRLSSSVSVPCLIMSATIE